MIFSDDLTNFIFENDFDESLDNVDFKNITSLTLGWCFDKSLNNVNFKNITSLTLGNDFNISLNDVDFKNITSLTLGYSFNQSLDNVNFKNITSLTLGCYFNQSLDNVDFKNITSLTLGWSFNKSLDNVNFKNITSLTLGNDFNTSLDNVNFKNITSLNLGRHFNKSLDNVNFKNIKRVYIKKNINIPKFTYISDGIWCKILNEHKMFYWKESSAKKYIPHPRMKYESKTFNLGLCVNFSEFRDEKTYYFIENHSKNKKSIFKLHLEPVKSIINDIDSKTVKLIKWILTANCKICAEYRKNISKTDCCRKKICTSCVLKIYIENNKCPFCRKILTFS